MDQIVLSILLLISPLNPKVSTVTQVTKTYTLEQCMRGASALIDMQQKLEGRTKYAIVCAPLEDDRKS